MPTSKSLLIVLSVVCVAVGISNVLFWRRTEARSPEPAPEVEPELAPYMARLQALTHKLGLSVTANNLELTRFYLYESREQVLEILESVPEYRGQPVALLAERFLDTPYADFAKALDAGAESNLLRQRYFGVISACNGCHGATQHAFINIPSALPTHNPYLQTFAQER